MERTRFTMEHNEGFALLIAVLVSGIVLAIGVSVLNITLKDFILSNIARDSEIAFYAANAGMECALYWDESDRNVFVDGGTVTCIGESSAVPSPGTDSLNTFQREWGTPTVCTVVSVEKFDCQERNPSFPTGLLCTTVEARGYNRSCDDLSDDTRTVERALRALY